MVEAVRNGWRPQPGPQHALIHCPIGEVFYGGARGGGKTDGMLGKWLIKAQRHASKARGIFFRREMPQLDAAIDRSKEIYYPLKAEWQEQKKLWVFSNGATLRFRALERDSDAEKYQGHNYTDLFFEELTNYDDPRPVKKLKATLRSADGVRCQFHATGNPGGPGHHWVKERYVDPAPAGWKVLTDEDGQARIFIPARLDDNAILMRNDPGYVGRLRQAGSSQLVRAWLEGDWSIIEGAFFDCWSTEKHVIRPCELPKHWTRFRSMDWGSFRPFSVGWWAIASEDFIHPDKRVLPKGALIRYREWYGASAPNVGLKMFAEDVARGILSREDDGERINYSVADPSIFAQDGGPSIFERMANQGCHWQPADNKRVGEKGHIGGWDQVRARLVGEDNKPMLYVFDTCAALIRTLPALQHDERKPEDVDTDGEDHAPDEARYACMSRPYTAPTPAGPIVVTAAAPTFNQLLDIVKRRRND